MTRSELNRKMLWPAVIVAKILLIVIMLTLIF